MTGSTQFLFYSLTLLTLLCHSGYAQEDLWEQTNGPFGGTILALGINAQDDIFALTSGSGVFRSSDNGVSWTEVSNGLREVRWISDLVITSAGDLFVASSEGIFRSGENGDSWQQVDHVLARSRTSVLAINNNGHIFASTENGLIRSMDNGASWTLVDSSRSPGAFAFNSAGDIFASSGGVIRSTDNGDSWTQINNGLTSTSVTSIAINGNDDIFVGTGVAVFPPESGQGIFRSTDNGDNWMQINAGLTTSHIWALAINPGGDIFAGTKGEGVFRSRNNGESWNPINNGFNSRWARIIAINNNNDIFVGTENTGVFRSGDNGESWQQINQGITATTVNVIGSNGLGDIFAGTGELDLAAEGGFGLFRSTDNGDSWHEIVEGLPPQPYVSAFGADGNGTVFIGAVTITGRGIFRSTNNGVSWHQVDSTIVPTSFAFNSTDDVFAGAMYSGGDRIMRSNDGGDSWSEINISESGIGVNSIAINKSTDVIFAATGRGVFRSTDNGNRWGLASTGLNPPGQGPPEVLVLATHPAGDVFALTRPDDFACVFRSTDNGDSWHQLEDGLLGLHFLSQFAVDAMGNIYVTGESDDINGFRSHVFRSSDRGDTWSDIGAGLNNIFLWGIEANNNGDIFVGTGGNGVFRYIETTTAISNSHSELPTLFRLEQNYPNPFNPTTTINYALPTAGHAELKIYNTLGQEIRTLVNSPQSVGNHQVIWDGKDDQGKTVASGLYIYWLQAAEFRLTRKMVMVR